jgi:polysaccharide biosynthesis transport protein
VQMEKHPRDPFVVWPVTGPTATSCEDGPLALVRAVATVVRRHKRWFAGWVGASVAIALLYAMTAAPIYTATATLLLEPGRQSVPAAQEFGRQQPLDLFRAESELQVIRSERILAHVFDALDLARHPEFSPGTPGTVRRLVSAATNGVLSVVRGVGLAAPGPTADIGGDEARQIAFLNFTQRLDARRVGQSYVVEVSFRSADPTLARKVANAAASAYIWQSVSAKADAAINGTEFVQGRINALSNQVKAADAAIALGTFPVNPTPDADARVIGAALQPLKPSSPRIGLVVALGAAVGLFGALFAAAMASVFDRRIRTSADVRRFTGLECFASVPEATRSRDERPMSGTSTASGTSRRRGDRFSAAIADLSTSIRLACVGTSRDTHKVVALVAWAPGAGASLLCGNLAAAMRASGRIVTVVDADVRGTSWQSSHWEIPDTTSPRTTTAVDAPGEAPDKTSARKPDKTSFDVRAQVPAPARTPNQSHFVYLGDAGLQGIVDPLLARGDVVLDLPALSVSAESRAAALYADAVVLVVAAGQTTHEELTAAVSSLRAIGANLTGVVLNRVGQDHGLFELPPALAKRLPRRVRWL